MRENTTTSFQIREEEKGNTKTTQSRSIATPRASPESLSMARAITSITNQGWRSTGDRELGCIICALIIIPTDNN